MRREYEEKTLVLTFPFFKKKENPSSYLLKEAPWQNLLKTVKLYRASALKGGNISVYLLFNKSDRLAGKVQLTGAIAKCSLIEEIYFGRITND